MSETIHEYLSAFDALPPVFPHDGSDAGAAAAAVMGERLKAALGAPSTTTATAANSSPQAVSDDAAHFNMDSVLASLWTVVNHVAIQSAGSKALKWGWLADEAAQFVAAHEELHDQELYATLTQLQVDLQPSATTATATATEAPPPLPPRPPVVPTSPASRASASSSSHWTSQLRLSSAQTLRRLASSMEDSTTTIHQQARHSNSLGSDGSPRIARNSPLIHGSSSISNSSSRANRLSSVVRAVSVFLQGAAVSADATEEETFRCHICFDESVPVREALALITCGHRFCQPCFKGYLEAKIKEGNVFPVCFHPLEQVDEMTPKTCGAPVDATEIQSIVSPQVWEKYLVFRYNKEHEYGRQCPYCSHSQECAGGPEKPACICEQCGKPFCFLHGNAHEESTCADYELKNAETEALNSATIQQIAKQCPGCKANVEKNGGCNHMKCVACQASFCWLCGEAVEDVPIPSHFNPESGSSCAGLQFDGDDQITGPWARCLFTMGIAVAVLFYPLAILLTLATSVLCCGFCYSSESFTQRVFNTFEMVLLAVAFIVGAPLAMVGVVLYLLWLFVSWCVCDVLLGLPRPPPPPLVDDDVATATAAATNDLDDLEAGRH